MYPLKLQEFLKSSTQICGVISKAILNPTKYTNTCVKYKEHIDEFLKLSFPLGLSISEKIQWIKNDIYTAPTCGQCGELTTIDKNTGIHPKYCNQQCYTDFITANNPSAKKVKIFGIIYPDTISAAKAHNISYFLIKQKLYSPDIDWQYYPNHDAQMQLELAELESASKFLVDKTWLIQQKLNYQSMQEISKLINVTLDHLRLAYYYHDIDTIYEQIPRESKILLENRIWLENQLKTNRTIDIAEELQCSVSLIWKTCDKLNIDIPCINGSAGEDELSEFISSLGFDVINNTRKEIYPKEIDVYIPSLHIGFEYNGLYHHKNKPIEHQLKYKLCQDNGIKLIQIFEDDWQLNRELIKNKIRHVLGISEKSKIFARKCTVGQITANQAKKFYDKTHIYGHKNSRHHFGLFYATELIGAMSFQGNKLERYATDGIVIGGFSKLFNACVTKLNLNEVITFTDLCWSNATDNVYIKNGFTLDSITRPGYFWVVNKKRESRLKYQKHKLIKFLNYDNDKSERQIMEENGYYRIFDAGHAKLIWAK